jgi:hypothetical protein
MGIWAEPTRPSRLLHISPLPGLARRRQLARMRPTGRPPTLWLQILLVGGLACVLLVLVQAYRTQR